MSIIAELKALDEKRAQLLAGAKDEALKKAQAAIKDLNELGYNYSLTQDGATTTTSSRRTGIRAEVMATLKKHPNGISRADLLEAMNAKGDKRAEQSISNALSNAKKQGQLTLIDGLYKTS
jgi:hypothetical protein